MKTEEDIRYFNELNIEKIYSNSFIKFLEVIIEIINTNDDFETLLYNTFEENTDKILKNFDLILNENNSLARDENKIIEIYMQTQELIYTTYFNKSCKYLTKSTEVDIEVDKLENYDKIMGTLL